MASPLLTATASEPGVLSRTAGSPVLLVLCSAGSLVTEAPRRLPEGLTCIGRVPAPAAGIYLPQDERLSRLHSTLCRDGDEVLIEDKDSKNGTFVNGERVERRLLRDGDLIRVGGSFFLLRHLPPDQDGQEALSGALLGTAPTLCALRRQLRLLAPASVSVLILGESGTGKELAARELHRLSGRTGPFLPLGCGALPDGDNGLPERQLFGDQTQQGLLRTAQGGTLFLDEITTLSPALQARLLRVVEERAVLPLGAEAQVPVDVRVLASTNRDPDEAVRSGALRGDLYARLAQLRLIMSPLRERREDILPLLQHAAGPLPPLSSALVEALLLHPWKYNVRELFAMAAELRLRGAGAAQWDLDLLPGRLLSAERPRESAPAPPPRPRRATPAGVPVLQIHDETVTILYQGASYHLKNSDGFRYLAYLIEHPGVEVRAVDLFASLRGGAQEDPRPAGHAGQLLDRQAKEAYRRRIEDLREVVEEATAHGDRERAARAQRELDALAQELARAVGLGGRDRRAADQAERTRVTVTQRIRGAIKKVEEACPLLGHHLSTCVRTGSYCVYQPPPR